MTILVASVTPDAAWVSQDSLMAFDVPPRDERPTGEPPVLAKPVQLVSKLHVLPRLGLVVAGFGDAQLIHTWAMALDALAPVADMDEAGDLAPQALRDIVRAGPAVPTAVYHFGHSARAGRVVGMQFSSWSGFAPELLTEGHTMMPEPDMRTGILCDELRTAWTLCLEGRARVESFHRMVAENVYESYRRGRLWAGRHVGGQLHCARIDRGGVQVSTLHTFPNHGALCGRLRREAFEELLNAAPPAFEGSSNDL